MSQSFITRFAPSPNGYLHLGHAFSALSVEAAARAAGGTMLLRIDDIDTSRAREEYVQAIFEDLAWLGLTWPTPVRVQTAHLGDYDAALQKLIDMGLTYPCFCTRKTLKLTAEGHYSGKCKPLSQNEINDRIKTGEQPALRLDTQKAHAVLGSRTLSLMNNGKRETIGIAALDNAVIQRKDIGCSYLLSCVVDDAAQGITDVIRGADIEHMTGLQVLLQTLLGLPTPRYTHHKLISDKTQKKLSKSEGAPSLRDARAQGTTAKDIRLSLGFSPMPSS